MSNHLHVVLSVEASVAANWSNEEVIDCWLQLYPARTEEQMDQKRAGLLGNPPARPNASAKHRPDRFKCQALADEQSLAAAMAFVDLNPIRAGIAGKLGDSEHTSAKLRLDALHKHPELAEKPLQPIAGIGVFQRLSMSNRQHIDLIDFTGRQVRPRKRGSIAENEPSALRHLGLDARHWNGQVQGIGSDYWRIVGGVETLIERAEAARQKWMKGIGFARRLVAGQ